MSNILFDIKGQKVVLGKELGRGGEGAVYEVEASKKYVAKLYSKIISTHNQKKLKLMVASPANKLLNISAWPVTTLHNQPNGDICGFVMERMPQNCYESHEICNIASRRRHYPEATWAFLLRTAFNCAAAFETVHEEGLVIGDVNTRNIVITKDARVYLLDTDSFQMVSNAVCFRCEAGVEEFTPPELQGFNFKDIDRNQNHDNFGLAVLIFQLLFSRHPFFGKYIGKDDNTPDIGKTISNYCFPYSLQVTRSDIAPLENWPALNTLPKYVSALFERAFSKEGSLRSRPTPKEWRTNLSSFEKELKRCVHDPSHLFYAQLHKCPWCEAAIKLGTEFFVSLVYSSGKAIALVFTDNIEKLEGLIQEFVSLEFSADYWSFVGAKPLVEIPAKSFKWVAPVRPIPPMRPAEAIQPIVPDPECVEVARKQYLWFITAGSLLTPAFAAGCYLGIKTIGFQPVTFISSIVVFGCFLAWAFSIGSHKYFRIRAQFDIDSRQHNARLASYRKELAEFPEKLAVYENQYEKYLRDQQDYNERLQVFNEAKGIYEKEKRQYDELVRTIDQNIGNYQKIRISVSEVVKNYQDCYVRQQELLKTAIDKHRALKSHCEADLYKLNERSRDEQMKEFLEDFLINDYKISQVGKVRQNSLYACGIVNAYQLTQDRLRSVSKLGPATETLVSWRREQEKKFRFDASKGVPIGTQSAVVRKWQRQQWSVEEEMYELLQVTKKQHLEACALISRNKEPVAELKIQMERNLRALKSLAS